MPVSTPRIDLPPRYRVLRHVATGGMAAVYAAEDEVLGREVAVKILDGVDGDAEVAAAWRREAQAVAGLGHPGIAGIFDAGTDEQTSFIVMELVPGRTLRDLLRERGRLGPAAATALVAQVADALAAAHRQGVVHCDVKPQNILVTPDGAAKLVDFGIARAANATRTLLGGEIHGSAAYLAPEQVRGERVDGRTDVYALGAVLYELLTGRQPFEGGPSLAAVVSRRLVADPPPPRSLDPSISPAIERVVLTALARAPADRFADAAQFRDALHAAAEAVAAEATRVIPGEAPTVRLGLPRRLGPRRLLLGLAAAALVSLLGGLAVWGAAAGGPGGRVVVPDLVGRRLSEVPALLEGANLAPGTMQTRPVERARAGTVVEQRPAPGQAVRPRDEVQLVVGVPQ